MGLLGRAGGSFEGAAHEVLEAFRSVLGPTSGVPHIEIKEYEHGGSMVRGMGTNQDFDQGQIILNVPREHIVATDDLVDQRFAGAANDVARAGLWISEKKVALLDHPSSTMSPQDEKLTKWIATYPTMEELKQQGGPLVTPMETLDKWDGLPQVGYLKDWTESVVSRLKKDIANYNSHRGDHPRMTWDDAVWGRALANSRDFSCRGAALAPVADLFNHTGKQANLKWWCDHVTGSLSFKTKRPIKAGEELTIDYGDKKSVSLAGMYGLIDENQKEPMWADGDCKQLHAAGLGVDKMPGSAQPMEKLIDALVKRQCKSDAELASSAAAAPKVAETPGTQNLGATAAAAAPQAHIEVATAAMSPGVLFAAFAGPGEGVKTCARRREISEFL